MENSSDGRRKGLYILHLPPSICPYMPSIFPISSPSLTSSALPGVMRSAAVHVVFLIDIVNTQPISAPCAHTGDVTICPALPTLFFFILLGVSLFSAR